MESGANPLAGFLGLWMFLKLVSFLGIAVAVIYALYCLSRIANNLDRVATALEQQKAAAPVGSFSPVETNPFGSPLPPVSPVPPAPPVPPVSAPERSVDELV